ncbi:MAG TPA: orotidine-5'-phosphate decarboxylase [Solirubrobacteraceae bacterium]|nr:orotidine-5'-phosphate decarboxylase [Solirubrobacteraceae bacterium]
MNARAVPFGDDLAARVERRRSQLVLGLDPSPAGLWESDGDPVQALRLHCAALIEAAGPACVAVKPQLACFELFGAGGRTVLGDVVQLAHDRDLLVIADGKRGDIDVTADAYARSLFGGADTPTGRLPGLGVDAATVNPLLGKDAIAPFIANARAAGAAVLLLVRTSNPGAADIQDLELAEGGTVWERLARIAAGAGADGTGASGLADVGAVVGATAPAALERARELMPAAPFLLPGVGAQGGRVEDVAAAFKPGRAGGLVSASRSIADAHRSAGGEPATAARDAAEALRERAWELASAVLGES